MQRRGFLQALMGAAAGLAGAGAGAAAATAASKPATVPAAAPTPEPLVDIPLTTQHPGITVDTSGFTGSIADAQATIAEMLKECRVTSVSCTTHAGGAQVLNVTYRHAPHAARSVLDDEADRYIGGRMKPRSVVVTNSPDPFGVEPLIYGYTGLERGVCEIEVEWAG